MEEAGFGKVVKREEKPGCEERRVGSDRLGGRRWEDVVKSREANWKVGG